MVGWILITRTCHRRGDAVLKNQKKGERAGVWLICPCGEQFYRWASRAKRSRCCSKVCQYKYARRPNGLTYQIKIENKGWLKSDDVRAHRFPKGHVPANFKGDAAGYDARHDWIKRRYGKAVKCEKCGSQKKIEWANKSWEYKRDLSDWMQLCYWCHRKYDRNGGWGLATERFPEMRRGKPRVRKTSGRFACVAL